MTFHVCWIWLLCTVCMGQDRQQPPPKPETPFAFAVAADSNGDGAVSLEEWDTFLAGLAVDETGAIDPGVFHDLVHARERARDRRARGREGTGDLPPDFPLDLDGDGSFELEDLAAVFDKLDRDGDGLIGTDELPARPERRRRGGPPRRH